MRTETPVNEYAQTVQNWAWAEITRARLERQQGPFCWRRQHGLRLSNPARNQPHQIPNIERASPYSVAGWAIGGNWQAQDMAHGCSEAPLDRAKMCPRCERVLSFDHFTRDQRAADGLHSYCKECRAADARLTYLMREYRYPLAVAINLARGGGERWRKVF